jgi:hypothetical protein
MVTGTIRSVIEARTVAPPRSEVRRAAITVVWLSLAVALSGAAIVVVSARIGAPPFAGEWRALWPWRAWPAVAVAVGIVAVAGRAAAVDHAPWRRLVVGWMLAALVWAVGLALVDGPSALLGSLASGFDYLAAVPDAGSAGSFLERFVADHESWPTHVQSHPPGMVLFLVALGGVGLARAPVVAVVVLVGAVAAVPAVLAALREVCGEAAARGSATLVVLVPAAVWWSSADALFAGVAAWAVTLAILAVGRRGPRSWSLAVGAGLLGATAVLLLSYGLVVLSTVPVAVAVWRRRFSPLLVSAAVAAVAYLVLLWLGFDWWAGLDAARSAYDRGVSRHRPYALFVVANLVVFAVAVGPAAVAGLRRLLRSREPTPLAVLAGAALLAVLAADVSGLSKGEVERIWLPFVPWVSVAAAALDRPRPWLVANAVVAIAVAVTLEARW